MDIDFFFPESVSLQTPEGIAKATLRAQISSSSKIIVHGDRTVIDVDDVIVHALPNGAIHRYSVLDVRYTRNTGHGLDAVTTLAVKKEGSKAPMAHQSQGQQVYNNYVSGNNARLNVHSSDNSVNTTIIGIDPVFEQLRSALEAHRFESMDLKRSVLEALDIMRNEKPHTPSFTEKFERFMALSSSCITVVSPFIPALAKLLTPHG